MELRSIELLRGEDNESHECPSVERSSDSNNSDDDEPTNAGQENAMCIERRYKGRR